MARTHELIGELFDWELALEIADCNEEVEQAETAISHILSELGHRADWLAEVVLGIEKDIAAREGRVERIKKELAVDESAIKRYTRAKNRIVMDLIPGMVEASGGELKTDEGTWKVRRSVSTVVDDVSKIPARFIREKVTFSPDKTEIKKVIQNGGTVEGARLQESKKAVRS